MKPSDTFFAGTRYAVFGAQARGRMQGPVLLAALAKAGKQAVAIEADGAAVKGAPTARTLEAAGPVDGVVLLPPAPWDAAAAELMVEAARQCREQGVARVWIYTAGDPAPAVEIAAQHGLDPCAGHCPCLYLPGGGFPHNLHRFLARFGRRADGLTG